MSTLNVNNINEAGGVDAVIASGVLDSGSLPAGSILQVVSTTKTDTFSTSSTSFVDVTGLSASITPSSASSKILVIVTGNAGTVAATAASFIGLTRNGTQIALGDADGSRERASTDNLTVDNTHMNTFAINHLDSPSTTSSLSYVVQQRTNSPGNAVYINRGSVSADNNNVARTVSSITLMEVAG